MCKYLAYAGKHTQEQIVLAGDDCLHAHVDGHITNLYVTLIPRLKALMVLVINTANVCANN